MSYIIAHPRFHHADVIGSNAGKKMLKDYGQSGNRPGLSLNHSGFAMHANKNLWFAAQIVIFANDHPQK
jgi:hypothetical protein